MGVIVIVVIVVIVIVIVVTGGKQRQLLAEALGLGWSLTIKQKEINLEAIIAREEPPLSLHNTHSKISPTLQGSDNYRYS